jgi:hypothetical protein
MKKTMQDIVPPEGGKKSIRNIPVPDRTLRSKFTSKKNTTSKKVSATKNKVATKTVVEEDESVIEPAVDVGNAIDVKDVSVDELKTDNRKKKNMNPAVSGKSPDRKKKRRIKIATVSFLFIFLLFIGMGASNMFASSTIQIVRHSTDRSFANEQVAVNYGTSDSVAQIIDVEMSLGSTVTATEEEYIETKASGEIIVYNDYSTKTQKLIKNTRFESPEGKIYRINKSVTIPGMKTQGGESIPGSLEVTVYADGFGESFDTDLTDFTIPGFKSDSERFENFYARSKTNITGGFEGTVKKVSDIDLLSAREKLQSEILSSIFVKAETNIPETFIYFKSLGEITYTNLPQSDADDVSVKINIKAELKLPIFNKIEFEELLAAESGDESSASEKPYLNNLDNLTISLSEKDVSDEEGDLTVLVTGESTMNWRLDLEKIKLDLAGKKKSNLNEILSQYETIDAAKAFVKPFWKNSFPSKINDITIEFIDSI